MADPKAFEVAILGMGSAGLLAARDLARNFVDAEIAPDKIIAIGRSNGGSSVLSSWYVAQYDRDALYERLLGGLGEHPTAEQVKLVDYIANNHFAETERFKHEVIANIDSGGVKQFTDGFSGIKALTGYSTVNSLPGAKLLRYLRAKVKSLGVLTTTANICDLERTNAGYRVSVESRGQKTDFIARKIIIATGGMAHTQEVATSAKADIANVLELAETKLGLKVVDLDRAVFFPFALREDGFRAGSLLPPSFMTRADVIEVEADGTEVDFLNDRLKAAIASGDYRPEFAELVTLFRQIRARGSKIVVKSRMSRDEFEHYKANDHYGYVFKDKQYEQALAIAIAPAYHSALGGIVVDSKCMTSDPHVYAVGEAALVYGNDRPIGGEHISAITLAPVVARDIADLVVNEQNLNREQMPSKTSLEDIRCLIDHYDHAIVANLDALHQQTWHATSDAEVNAFLRRLLAACSDESQHGKLRKAYLAPEEATLHRIRETQIPVESCWSDRQIVGYLQSLSQSAQESIQHACVKRLLATEYAATVKYRLGQSVRDTQREASVIKSVVSQTDNSDVRTAVTALYRWLILPLSFEIQTLYRRHYPLPKQAPSTDIPEQKKKIPIEH